MNLDGFFDAVVDNEQHEDDLTRQYEIVAGSHVAQQFDGAQVVGRNDAPGRRQLSRQSTYRHIITLSTRHNINPLTPTVAIRTQL